MMKTNLSSTNIAAIEKQFIGSENKSTSPGSSPRSSPRPSPRPQNKREHTKSEALLTVNCNREQPSLKQEGSPSSQDSGSRERINNANNIEITPPQDNNKPDSANSSSSKDRREGRSKKKSSWFNSFYPSYKSRSEDFKRLFKEVPDDERLVVDYSCAVQKEILVQGRLYVTQNYLCFYANIFGWETNLTLKWKDVAAITKEKTALVIPNAILISTKSERYFFTSFVARDKTYLMLFRVWQNALMDQPMSAQEMWQWVHQCYGSELGLTSDDEDYIAPGGEDDKLSVRLSVESFSEECSGMIEELGDSLGNMIDKQETEDLNINTSAMPRRRGSESHLPTDATDNSESEVDRPIKKKLYPSFLRNKFFPKPLPSPDSDASLSDKLDESIQCTNPHEGRHFMDVVVPIHIDHLFTLLFTSSKFYLDFHAARKTTDLTQTPWTHNPLDNSKSRVVSLNMALLATMGPKSAQVTETQILLPCSKVGNLYSIDVETVNAGVPYADSFFVLVHYCLQKVSETHSSVSAYAQIKYKKSVWGLVKGMIERNCYSGLEDYYNHLSRSLQAESENAPELKRKSRRKRRMHSIMPRSASEENRISAPLRKKSHSDGIFSTDVCTLIVFSVLLLLLFLNVMLYYKLWSLEETPTYTLLDLHLLKNPPKNHEEWIKLIQQQETLHTLEAQKWLRLLKNAIQLLRQAEESLNELQRSIHINYANKMSVLPEEVKIEKTETEEQPIEITEESKEL